MTSGDDHRRTLDVREIDGEPFGRIVDELEALGDDQELVLLNSFEPEPLYGVLESRGFEYVPTEEDGVWRITIERA